MKLTTPTDREIRMTCILDAPAQLVFDALTKPALLRRWFTGPPGWSLAVCEFTPEVGSVLRYVWRAPSGNEIGMRGIVREVVANARLVTTESFDKAWYPGEAVGTTLLGEQAGKTTLTQTVLYESKEARDTVLKNPIEEGEAAGYRRLAGLLAEQQAGKRAVA